VSVAEVLVLASALGQAPAALVFPAGYVSEVEYLPGKTSDPLEAEDWWDGQHLVPDQRMKILNPGGDLTREWAINIARKHRDVVNRIRALYRGAFESQVMERTGYEPDNESETARAVARPCFESRLRSSSCVVMISVWGEGIFLTSSGRCWSRCCRWWCSAGRRQVGGG
jgi:hypothetical protein